jgi:hypothetical protein
VDANAGRAVTNDAMDFLKRLDRKEEEEEEEGKAIDEGFDIVAAMLEEISRDMLALRRIIVSPRRREFGDEGGSSNGPDVGMDDGDDAASSSMYVRVGEMSDQVDDANVEDEDCHDYGVLGDGGAGPLERIDLVVEKIRRALAVVGASRNSKMGGGGVSDDLKNDEGETEHAKLEEEELGEIRLQSTRGVESTVESGSRENDEVHREHGQLFENDLKMQSNDDDDVNLDEGGGNRDSDISVVVGGVIIERQIPDIVASVPNSSVPTLDVEPGGENLQSDLDDALRKLVSSNDINDLKVGAQMLYLYCRNISKNPSVPRYRKIYTNNSNFRNKVGNLIGARDFLVAVGFVERPERNLFEWSQFPPSPGSDKDDDGTGSSSKLDFALVALELMKNGKAAGGGWR